LIEQDIIMSIRIKLREDMAVVRFTNATDKEVFVGVMRSIRDSTSPYPISIKNEQGNEIPRIPPPKPTIEATPIEETKKENVNTETVKSDS
jgi:hypothetical protein